MQLISPLTADPRVVLREKSAGVHLPFGRHIDDFTIETRDGLLMQILKLDGLMFETAETDALNYRFALREAMLRTLGSSRYAIYHHVLRRSADMSLRGDFPDAFSKLIDERWRQRLASRELFVNDLYLTIVRRPLPGKIGFADRLKSWVAKNGAEHAATVSSDLRSLHSACEAIVASLAQYGARPLTVYRSENVFFSEPLELLSELFNGQRRPVVLPHGDLGHHIPDRRISFGQEAFELSKAGAEPRSFGAIMSIKDNMKTAVDRIGQGKVRQVNARFAAMASHYLFETDFCNPASGWEKGQVEKNVQDARRRLWQPMPNFPDLDALNAWLEERCIAQWGDIQHGVLPGTVADVHAAEIISLMPMGRAFDGFVEHTKRVSPTCLIAFERNRYSVPASFANRPVSLRVYPDRLVIAAEGQILCEHNRIIDRSHQKPGQTIYDWRHYLAVVQRKPGALRNGAPFLEMPEAFRQLQGHLLKRLGGDREMVEILALVLQHNEQAVLSAVELALEAGVPTKTHILNVLHRLIDGKAPPASPIDAPQALRLAQEPVADVERYDTLRALRHAS